MNYLKYSENLFTAIEEESTSKKNIQEAEVLNDGDECFEVGKKLIRDAKKRLYTTISFNGSLTPKPTIKEKEMMKELKNKITNDKDFDFRRYMRTSIEGVKKQYNSLEELKKKNKALSTDLYDFEFSHLELIISDDNVLIVFPDSSSKDIEFEKVAFGILIKRNSDYARFVKNWLENKLA